MEPFSAVSYGTYARTLHNKYGDVKWVSLPRLQARYRLQSWSIRIPN